MLAMKRTCSSRVACSLTVSCLLMLAGCVSPKGASEPYLCVALATYVDGSCPAFYDVKEVVSGSFPTNSVIVMYSENSLPLGGLPQNAILILQSPAGNKPPPDGWYLALGGDAYRGILPDTTENRRRIEGIRLADLSVNSRSGQLPRHQAISIARVHANRLYEFPARNRCSAVRSEFGYGWFVLFEWGRGEPGSSITLIVGDDGKMKDRYASGEFCPSRTAPPSGSKTPESGHRKKDALPKLK